MNYVPMKSKEIRGIMRRRRITAGQLAAEMRVTEEYLLHLLENNEIADAPADEMMEALQRLKEKGREQMGDKNYRIEVTAHIAELSKNRKGGTLELNKSKYEDKPERWDLRRWFLDENGVKCAGRGVVLSDYEFEQLRAVMMEY